MEIDFHRFVAETEARKRALGVDESPEAVEALRNKGGRRTAAKRELLRRAADRARAAGREPVPAHY